MPGWLAFVLTAVLVLGHLRTGYLGAGFLHAVGTTIFMVAASSVGGDRLAGQLTILTISSAALWVRHTMARAAYRRRVQRTAQFRDDVYAARRDR